jgi:hypothetical protein
MPLHALLRHAQPVRAVQAGLVEYDQPLPARSDPAGATLYIYHIELSQSNPFG